MAADPDMKDDPFAGKVRSDDEMLLDMHRSMRRSTYVLSSGLPSREYADFDGYYLGGKGDFEFDAKWARLRMKELAEKIVPVVVERARDHATTRLAFIEKRDDGPVGMLSLMNLILFHSKLEGCIVRPDKRLFAASIKGRPIIPGERIMIVSDVATMGTTISRPAKRLRELGAIVPVAYVLLDVCRGAKTRLSDEGIALYSYWNLEQRNELINQLTRDHLH